ncbi:hypothetical protein [Endozoicomonas sp. ALC066]|uniref:hypothetical protein n=1 Tax=Endozoicomonas sp. ALC066 TaxID=3403078 RepID=UPI003BB60E5F
MASNINEETGVPYGYISASALDSELVDRLMQTEGFDISYVEAVIETVKSHTFAENVIESVKRYNQIDLEDINWTGRIGEDYVIACGIMEIEEDYPSSLGLYGKVEHIEVYEPTVTGVFEGVHYLSSWMGGALHFFISQSPVTTDCARRASPCVPGAGILDTLDGDYTSYDVPADWRADNGS